ncbi:hypothetical protein GCM10009827_068520 [Dactylosporangium maewongense]|uniref:Peptidase S26 domain-containing protein n=1 Tax=Dactylosporangium maewongense TaxID=634393 RepID=A0ABP4M811_9ACTN
MVLATLAGCVVLLLAAGVVVARRSLLVVTVCGGSMAPTYHDGDRVLVSRRRRPAAGMVVVLRQGDVAAEAATLAAHRSDYLVKRLAALPGDAVPAAVRPALGTQSPDLVPEDAVVVLGDDADSIDSRAWGFLPLRLVVGVVVADLRTAGR